MARGHRLAFRIIHAQRPDAMVGLSHSAPFVMPSDPGRQLDRAAAWMRDYGLNRLFFDLLGRAAPAAGSISWASTTTRATSSAGSRGAAPSCWARTTPGQRDGEGRRYSVMGWEVLASRHDGDTAGFYRGLGVPLMITENGIATDDEALRRRLS